MRKTIRHTSGNEIEYLYMSSMSGFMSAPKLKIIAKPCLVSSLKEHMLILSDPFTM